MSKSGMLRTRKLATAAIAGLLLTITSCSSQGGAQNAPGASGGGGDSSSPSLTIAMVTHEAPGSTFWDRIRAGAEQAAEQHGIELKYSNDPDSGKQATLIQNAIDSQEAPMWVSRVSGGYVLVWRRWSWTAAGASTPLRAPSAFQG